VQEQVTVVVANLDLTQTQQVYCVEQNSLEALPKLVEQGTKFDVIIIDGDHNYHTVAEEMKHIDALTYPESIVVIDDVYGRWGDRDLFYAERPGYEDNKNVTQRIDTEKHGVKPAVDEWLALHPEWKMSQPIQGETVLLMR
jgi:response regulator of citrate/malate metabolism